MRHRFQLLGRLALVIALAVAVGASVIPSSAQGQSVDATFDLGWADVMPEFVTTGDEVEVAHQGLVLPISRWQQHSIPVCWVNPGGAANWAKTLIREAATEWTKVANINFTGWQACNGRFDGIQIRLADEQPRSIIGSFSRGRSPSMYLNTTFQNWDTRRPDLTCSERVRYCVYIIALHEFGHAIGILHEQDRIDAGRACRDRFPRQPIPGQQPTKSYDPRSVMNYCHPDVEGLDTLSPGDITAARVLYPHLCAGKRPTRIGTPGGTTITGTPGNDVIQAYEGADTIESLGGSDTICAGPGDDKVFAGGGQDIVLGGPGSDILFGGPGGDLVAGGSGNDTIRGGPGPDVLRGGTGDDILKGEIGNDRISAGPGADRAQGGVGNDVISGDDGAPDQCWGEGGRFDKRGPGCERFGGFEGQASPGDLAFAAETLPDE